MVLKNINRIKESLPNVLHVVMFYNDGTVFQTTFEPPVNIPKLGTNLSEILKHFKNLKEFCTFDFGILKNMIFETKNIIIGIIKVGEESFMAIFMENQGEGKISFDPIKKYISRLEYLIDMDRIEVEREELIQMQRELDDARKKLGELETLKDITLTKSVNVKELELKEEIVTELNVVENEINTLKKFIQEKAMIVEKLEDTVKNSELKWLKDKYE